MFENDLRGGIKTPLATGLLFEYSRYIDSARTIERIGLKTKANETQALEKVKIKEGMKGQGNQNKLWNKNGKKTITNAKDSGNLVMVIGISIDLIIEVNLCLGLVVIVDIITNKGIKDQSYPKPNTMGDGNGNKCNG